jgi:hypothetical protein
MGPSTRPVFKKHDWGRFSGTYMTDIRQSANEGAIWEFHVDTSRDQRATLNVEPITTLPQGWDLRVYDLGTGIGLSLENLPHAFEASDVQEFLLIAGTPAYIETKEVQSGMDLKGQLVGIRPNPSGSRSRITFFVPAAQDVSLRVFSVDGRLLETLVDSRMDAGIHTIYWDGLGDYGQVAPGIYFLKLVTPQRSDTRKIIRVR